MADRKRAREAPARRERTRHLELEHRAAWIVREWNRRPTLTYLERIELIREKFEVSQRTAETIHARAGDIYRDLVSEMDIGRILTHQWDLYERAIAKDKLAIARKVLFDMALVKGITKPAAQVNIGNMNVSQFAHVQVLQMTPVQRANRERELAAREAVVLDVPTSAPSRGDDATDTPADTEEA